MKLRRNSSHLLNDLRNFNDIFRKVVTYIILKVTKNQAFTLSLENTFSEKPLGGQVDPSIFRVNVWCPLKGYPVAFS